jgi:DNA polymerase-3 subunit chi
MTQIWFYHLEYAPLETVLPSLLQKTLERGWKAVVRAGSTERLTALDAHLWTFRDESFLPHGMSSQPHAEHQSVLLTVDEARPNNAEALFIVDSAALSELDGGIDGMSGIERCFVIFDGRDEQALGDARSLWKRAKDLKIDISYWQQGEQGGWEKKA